MSNNYMKKSLIYGVKEHSINQNVGSAEEVRTRISEVQKMRERGYRKRERCENRDIGSASGNTARQCVHKWEAQVGRVGEEQ